MSYWDFAPSSHWRAKPMTKAELRRAQARFAEAAKLAQDVRDKEAAHILEEQSEAESKIQDAWI